MEMHQVRYFLAVARTLNFTRAAEECNVAQPSLTRAIKLLEDELGGELFRRERSLSHLTDLGTRMLPLLQQCYESALTAKSLAKDVKSGKVAALCLALSRTIGMDLVVAHLTELVHAMPGLELKILRGTAADISEALKKGDVEVAVTGGLGTAWDRLDVWALFTESSSLAVPRGHRLAGRNRAVDLSELSGERLLVRSYCEQAEDLNALLRSRGISPCSLHRVESEADLAALIAAGLGVAIAPNSTALPEAASRLELVELQLTRTVTAYSVSGRQRSPAASMLLKLLRAADWSHLANRAVAHPQSLS
jgi:DNA-binding transcriptional LysR family regulator